MLLCTNSCETLRSYAVLCSHVHSKSLWRRGYIESFEYRSLARRFYKNLPNPPHLPNDTIMQPTRTPREPCIHAALFQLVGIQRAFFKHTTCMSLASSVSPNILLPVHPRAIGSRITNCTCPFSTPCTPPCSPHAAHMQRCCTPRPCHIHPTNYPN